MQEKSIADCLKYGITVDRKSALPLSEQVERSLTRLLRDGVLQPGDRLPNEIPWSQSLGINRSTLRVTMGRLVKNGMLERRKRAGTFVCDPLKRVKNIGFFYFREATAVLSEGLHLIQEKLDVQGFDLKVVAFPYTYYDQVDLVNAFKRRGLSGAVLVTLPTPGCLEQLQRLEAQGIPYVRMGNKCFTGKLRAPLITGDDRRGVQDAFDFLQSLGHQKIGYLSHISTGEQHTRYRACARRLDGYQPRWFKQMVFEDCDTGWSNIDPDPVLRAYLQQNPELTAVLVDSCRLCVPLMQIAAGLGRPVPKALSLISLAGKPFFNPPELPKVTYLGISRTHEATLAVEHLLRLIENGLPAREQIVRIPFQRVEGQSIAPPAKVAKSNVDVHA